MAKSNVANHVERIRKSRGLSSAELARRVGVNRQTIYATEAGTYVPNTEVALKIARVLEVTVDELFALASPAPPPPEEIEAELLSSGAPVKGQPVRVCQIGAHWVSVPVSATPYYMPEADGVIRGVGRHRRAGLLVFGKEEASQKRLVLAGCDPASSLLSHMVQKVSGVEIVSAAASSKLALTWLREGNVHIAGTHLQDPKTGEFNLPYIRAEFPDEDFLVVTFASWEEGFVVKPGNPKGIVHAGNLTGRGVRLVNREPGSGSRALLDKLLRDDGVPAAKVQGYDRVAYGHLAAAYGVVAGDADVCVATRSAAQAFALDFVALHGARYDLVMRKRTAELPSVKAFLDVLQRATLRRKLEVLAGYDTSETGAVVV